MEGDSKADNLELEMFDFNEVEFDNQDLAGQYQQINETDGDFSKGIEELGSSSSPPLTIQPNSKHNSPGPDQNNELLESPSENNGQKLCDPSGSSPADPTLLGASQMDNTAENVEGELGITSTEDDDEPHLDQMKDKPDTFEHGYASHDNSNPLSEQVELANSAPAGSAVESLPHHESSNLEDLMEPAFAGFEGCDSSVGDAKDDDQITVPSPPFSPLIMQATQSFPLALAEKITLNEDYVAESSHEINLVQANQPHGLTEGSLQAEPPMVEPDNRGKSILFGDGQFEQNNVNNHFNDNQQAVTYPVLFPQYSSGFEHLNGGPIEINYQQPHSWMSTKEYDFFRPLAPSGSQVNQINATNINADPLCYNFMLPPSSSPLRPLLLNNPLQMINQVPNPNMPNASDSSLLQQHSVPMQLVPQAQNFTYQQNQVPTYNPQTFNPTLPNGGYAFQDLSDQYPSHQFNPARQTTNLLGPQFSRSMLQEPLNLMPSGSYQFPMVPSYSEQLPRLQTGQQIWLNQTTRPIATYPTMGISMSNLGLNPLLQQETGGTLLSSNNELGRRGHARGRFDLGESSSLFKRYRRESTLPQASPAGMTSLSLHNEATGSNIGNLYHPRQVRNSVYDPMFEGIGLPIDPHLRLFIKK